MILKKYRKMNKSQIVLSMILFIGILSVVSGQVEIGEDPQDIVGAFIEPPEVPSGGGGGGNPFDQSLNTTDDVTFNNIIATGNLTDTACFTFDGNINIASSASYWKYGLNLLSAGEGVKMFDRGSITQFGWTCSGYPTPEACDFEHEIRKSGVALVTETWDAQNQVFNYGRDDYTFTSNDLLQVYYKRTGGFCLNSGKKSCGGFVCVIYDN